MVAPLPPPARAPIPAPPAPPSSAPFSRVVRGSEQPTVVSNRVPASMAVPLFRTSVKNVIVCVSFLQRSLAAAATAYRPVRAPAPRLLSRSKQQKPYRTEELQDRLLPRVQGRQEPRAILPFSAEILPREQE